MRYGVIKKLLACVLCAVIAASLLLPAFAAGTSTSPIIYIADIEDIDLYEYPDTLNQKLVFGTNSSGFQSAVVKMLAAVILSDKKGVSDSIPDVISGINSIMSPIACNASGKSKNPAVGPLKYDLPISQYPGDKINTATVTALAGAVSANVNADRFFVFLYDWRLSPADNAASLQTYIDSVKRMTRASSVSLIAAGTGGVVANAYLYTYRAHAAQNVYSCVFLDSPLTGNALIGDIMRGRVAKTSADADDIISSFTTIRGEERGQAVIKYLNDDPNNYLYKITQSLFGSSKEGQLIGALTKIMFLSILQDEGSASDYSKLYNNFVLLADENIYSTCLREYLRNMPGLWALVPQKDYEGAVRFLYGDEIIGYEQTHMLAGVREIVDNTASTLKRAQADGIKTYVVANYGRQIAPLTVSIDDVSDGIESAKYASAGAITAECGTDWDYSVSCLQSTYHNHRSPDNDIDASTCALPENTWFIKDLKHLDFQYQTAADFIAWLVLSDTQKNVWEDVAYPQYLIYSKTHKTVTAYSDNSGTEGRQYMHGDIDRDGIVTAADARLALRISVGLEVPEKIIRVVADVDGDGAVAPADARLILRYSVGLLAVFPADE